MTLSERRPKPSGRLGTKAPDGDANALVFDDYSRACQESVLDKLISRYGETALLTVRPQAGASGKTEQWITQIDGIDVSDLQIQTRELAERPGIVVMFLVSGDEEVEIDHWAVKYEPYGPLGVMRRLGDIKR